MFAADAACPRCGRSACTSGRKLDREPWSASTESAHARSAALARRRARTRPSAVNAPMNWVPFTSERPSLAWRRIGSRPARASASRPSSRSPSTHASPSPTSGSARWASGARSPLAPTEPRLGTTGTTPRFRQSTSSSTVATLAPELPFARAFARSSIAARMISIGYGSPTPHAWLRNSRSCSSSVSSTGMVWDTNRPNPVLIPYVCSCEPWAARSTSPRAATIFFRASWARSTLPPSTATAQTSSTLRSSPVSAGASITRRV
jgi:hypothetical protein